MPTIAEWLASLGLSEYAQRFAENYVDASVLRNLTDQDLTEIGVPLGHRRKMLGAIAELNGRALEPGEGATKPAPRDEAERRHLTVIFCELAGSAALSSRLDPEDMWGVIASYHACIGDIIGRHHGMIARYMDECVLAYFGYPRAQEDDAEQAVRAALTLVDAMANLQTDADAVLQARIGIATGTVIVSELLIDETPAEQAVIGDTPNLAARLQTLAEPGTVLICPSTRRLTGEHFDYHDLGTLALKGWAEPVQVWQVLRTAGFRDFRRYPLDRTNLAGAAHYHCGARAAASGTAAHHCQIRIHSALAELSAYDDDLAHASRSPRGRGIGRVRCRRR